MRVAKATADEIAVCIEIRRVVFVLGQDVPEELEVDGLDPTCTHFLAAVDGEPAGTARLRITDNGAANADTPKSGSAHNAMSSHSMSALATAPMVRYLTMPASTTA